MISDMLSEFLREQTVLPCQSKLDKIYQNCNKLGHSFGRMQTTFRICVQSIDQEFVTSTKKIANFNEFSEIKKIRKNSYKNSLNARVGVAFQWNSLLNIYFLCYKI